MHGKGKLHAAQTDYHDTGNKKRPGECSCRGICGAVCVFYYSVISAAHDYAAVTGTIYRSGKSRPL